jgi:ABC-type multidrug transport system ATPase subunit
VIVSPRVALEIRNLVVPVHGGLTVRVPHLELLAGRTTALLGRSASGKSTLLRQLGRVDGGYLGGGLAATGAILAHALAARLGPSLDLMRLTRRQLQARGVHGRGVGFVFQQEGLFPDRDALGNVRWALEAHGVPDAEGRAREALVAVELAPDRVVATLSGGERKRLALARCLALRPPILLLDEPFTGLDPAALAGLHAIVAAERDRGTTIVLVTHQREDVSRLADDVVFMASGQLVRTGPREALAAELSAFFDEGRLPG